MAGNLRKGFNIVIVSMLVFQLSGCGTLLYPERKGQRAGHVDAGVAILDGLGLLFFLIPGVIAFVVDFNNGTIYLPGTSRVSVDGKQMKMVKFDPKHTSLAAIEKIIKEQTNRDVTLDEPNMKVSKLKSTDEIKGCIQSL